MTWWTDESSLTAAVMQYGSPTQAARALGGISERRVREAWRTLQSGNPLLIASSAESSDGTIDAGASAKITETTAILISAANPRGTDAKSPEDLFEEHQLDPAEWDYRVDMTSYDALAGDGQVTTLHRIRVTATRKLEARFTLELPAGMIPRKARKARQSSKPHMEVIFADPHAPNYEQPLIDASIAWLEEFKPKKMTCLGDAADNSPFKRHKRNRRHDCTIDEAIWSTTELLSWWANASPDTIRRVVFGNHDFWIYDRLLEAYPGILDVRRWQEDDPYVTIGKILKLDELGYAYDETGGEYHDVTHLIANDLVGMHGTKTGKGGGATKEQAGWENTSVVQGHDHKLALTAISKRLPAGGRSQRYAISAGTMASSDLGYSSAQDVAQGFPVFTVHRCGRWHVDFALYDPVTQSTTWRDWIWQP